MRILFLAPDTDLRGFAGDVSHVEDLSVALDRLGCFVDLVVAQPGIWHPPARVTIHQITSANTILSAMSLLPLICRLAPDVIYERRTTPKLAAVLSLLSRRPYFVEINGLVDQESVALGTAGVRSRWGSRLRIAVRRVLLLAASRIITVTDNLRAEILRIYRLPTSKVAVVPNGVDLTIFRPTPALQARESLGLPDGYEYIVFVGNLVPWEGVDTLISAMSQILIVRPKVRLLIVGDGPEQKRLAELGRNLGVADSVRFVGQVPHPTVPLWISAADICALPLTVARNAEIGTSAIKLREYLACGRPVIASNLPGAGPFLEQEGLGLGIPGDDPSGLARGIVRLLSDPALLETMGQRAGSFALRELSWDRSASSLLRIMSQARYLDARSGAG